MQVMYELSMSTGERHYICGGWKRTQEQVQKKGWANNPSFPDVVYDIKLMESEVFGQLS